MTLVLGVDPGLTGALALVETEGPRLVAVLDMPVIRYGKATIIDGARILDWLDGRGISAIVIEDVHSMPANGLTGRRQGIASTFAFGRAVGGVEAVLTAIGVPMIHARPQVWKKRAGLGKDKLASLDLARLRFGPREEFRRKKDEGRAESCLIALYGRVS
jgi:crossover junction endodeoxyribonuclease RuvC